MVKQRETHRIIMSEEWQHRVNNKQCPVCAKAKSIWIRRTDWTCCSTKCTDEYSENVIYGWGHLKNKVFKRDGSVCVKCGKVGGKLSGWQNNDSGLIADHIIPIALGGKQWDMDNVQTLCLDCDRIKTKQDQADIAKLRGVERVLVKGQKQLYTKVSL